MAAIPLCVRVFAPEAAAIERPLDDALRRLGAKILAEPLPEHLLRRLPRPGVAWAGGRRSARSGEVERGEAEEGEEADHIGDRGQEHG